MKHTPSITLFAKCCNFLPIAIFHIVVYLCLHSPTLHEALSIFDYILQTFHEALTIYEFKKKNKQLNATLQKALSIFEFKKQTS